MSSAFDEEAEAPALLDVIDDPELLSLVVCHLAAHDQCAVGQAAKLFALVVSEHQRETSFMHSAVTDSVTQARETVMPQLKVPPSFGLVFANAGGERRKKLKSLVRALPPSMHWVGGEVGTLVGTNPTGEHCAKHSHGFALSLGAFPEATVGSCVVGGARRGEPLEEQLQGALEQPWKVFLVITLDGGRVLGRTLELLQTAHPEAAIIGGIAVGRYMLHAHRHRMQLLTRNNDIVIMMFGGNVPMHALVCAGGGRGAAKRLHDARRQLVERAGKQLMGGLMFTCTARNEERDARDFTAAFAGVPLVGMPCGGEVCMHFLAPHPHRPCSPRPLVLAFRPPPSLAPPWRLLASGLHPIVLGHTTPCYLAVPHHVIWPYHTM